MGEKVSFSFVFPNQEVLKVTQKTVAIVYIANQLEVQKI
jgi:hypothetical protein